MLVCGFGFFSLGEMSVSWRYTSIKENVVWIAFCLWLCPPLFGDSFGFEVWTQNLYSRPAWLPCSLVSLIWWFHSLTAPLASSCCRLEFCLLSLHSQQRPKVLSSLLLLLSDVEGWQQFWGWLLKRCACVFKQFLLMPWACGAFPHWLHTEYKPIASEMWEPFTWGARLGSRILVDLHPNLFFKSCSFVI